MNVIQNNFMQLDFTDKGSTIQSAKTLLAVIENQLIPDLIEHPTGLGISDGRKLVQMFQQIDSWLISYGIKPILNIATIRFKSELEKQANEIRDNLYLKAQFYKDLAERATSLDELGNIQKKVALAINDCPELQQGIFNMALNAINKRASQLA